MAGNRIHGEFKSYAGVEYDIYIYDAEFVASVEDQAQVIGDPSTGDVWGDPSTGNVWGWPALDNEETVNVGGLQTHKVEATGFQLSYDTSNEGPYTPLMPSRLTFKLYFETAAQDSFIAAMAASSEGQFLVRVLKNGALFWTGVLVPDVISWEDQYYPYEFTFTAIDGLSRLKSVDYSDDGDPFQSKATLLDILYTCLGKLETNGFYDPADAYFVNNVNWWEVRHSASYANDPLALTRVNQAVFSSQDEQTGEYTFLSCFDVMKEIAQNFGARIFYADGAWRFLQNTEYSTSVQTRRTYTKTKALASFTGGQSYDLVINQTTLARAQGEYEYLPALDRVEIVYNHRGAFNLLLGQTWSHILQQQGIFNYEIGEIANNSGEARLQFSFQLTHLYEPYDPALPDPIPWDEIAHVFRIKLSVGPYSLRRDITPGSAYGSSFGPTIWDGPGQYYYYQSSVVYQVIGPLNPFYPVNEPVFTILTPPIPVQGDCEISFEYVYSIDLLGNTFVIPFADNPLLPDPPRVSFWTNSPELQLLGDGTNANNVDFKVYRALNTTTGNSSRVELKAIFGDGPTAADVGALETWNGSTWGPSTAWGIRQGGPRDKKLLQRVVERILAAQATPRKRYNGQLISTTNAPAHAYSRLKINNEWYIFLGGNFLANPDTWQLSIFLIKIEDTITLTDEITPQVPRVSPGLLPPPNVPGEIFTPVEFLTASDTEGLQAGYTSYVETTTGVADGYFPGDSITVVDGQSGNAQVFEVLQYVSPGDTIIPVSDTVTSGFSSLSGVTPTPSNIPLNTIAKLLELFTFTYGNPDDPYPITITHSGGTLEVSSIAVNLGATAESGLRLWLRMLRLLVSAKRLEDATTYENDGLLYGGYAWEFDGIDDYIAIGDTGKALKTISFWLYYDAGGGAILDLDGGTHWLEIDTDTLIAHGFASPVIYVDGIATDALTDRIWQHVCVVANTAIDADDVEVGRSGSAYFTGALAGLKFFSLPLTASQVMGEARNPERFAGPSLGPYVQAYWPLTEGDATGLAFDIIGGKHGAISGCTALTAEGGVLPQMPLANFARWTYFAANMHISAADSADLDLTGALTISAWIYTTDSARSQGIVVKNPAGGYRVWMEGGKVRVRGNSLQEVASATTIQANRRYHVLVVIDGAAATIYLDGVEDASGAIAPVIATSGTLNIGGIADSTGADTFQGFIFEASLWAAALSAANAAALFAGAAPDSVQGAALRAWWTDTGETLWSDREGVNDGTATGTHQYAYLPEAPGAGKALAFPVTDGENKRLKLEGEQYAVIDDDASLDVTTAYTIMAWVKPKRSDVAQGLITKQGAFFVTMTSIGAFRFEYKRPLSHSRISTFSFPEDEWTHIAVTFANPGNFVMYVNGQVDGTVASLGATSASASPVYLGITEGGSDFFRGYMDEVKIYARTLNATEVLAEYQNTLSDHE